MSQPATPMFMDTRPTCGLGGEAIAMMTTKPVHRTQYRRTHTLVPSGIKQLLLRFPTPTNVHDDNIDLKAKNKALQVENAGLIELLAKTGEGTKESSRGLIPQKLRSPKAVDKNIPRRQERARKCVELSKIVQGEVCLATNICDIVQAATRMDPSVPAALEEAGCFPREMIDVPDGRTTTGFREEPAPLVHPNNACKWQYATHTTNSSVNSLRILGGGKLVNCPRRLQRWCVCQEEMPVFDFVDPGNSTAVGVVDLADTIKHKIAGNAGLSGAIRTAAPYNKSKGTHCWWMVSAHAVPSVCAVVSQSSKLSPLHFSGCNCEYILDFSIIILYDFH